MISYDSAYPLFEDKAKQIQLMHSKALEFEKHQPNAKLLIHKTISMVQDLRNDFMKNPSISAENLAYILNETYKRDRSMHGIIVEISFQEKIDRGRLSRVSFSLYKNKKY